MTDALLSSISTPGKTSAALCVLDIRLDEEHLQTPGVWLAACSASQKSFPGATVYLSSDGGSTYNSVAFVQRPCVMGTVLEELPAPAVPGAWDLNSTTTVRTLGPHGALASAPVVDVLSEQSNLAYIYGEILSFVDVTDQGGSQYTLETLVRQLRASDDGFSAAGSHGDPFVILDTDRLMFLPLSPGMVGRTLYFSITTPGQALTDTLLPLELEFQANCCRPPSPTNVSSSLSGGHIVVAWEPRAALRPSAIGYVFDTTDHVDGYPEEYTVEVYDNTANSPVRTERVSGARTWTWTASEQVSDGYTGSNPVSFNFRVMRHGLYNTSPYSVANTASYSIGAGAE